MPWATSGTVISKLKQNGRKNSDYIDGVFQIVIRRNVYNEMLNLRRLQEKKQFEVNEDAEVTVCGTAFNTRAPATGKPRSQLCNFSITALLVSRDKRLPKSLFRKSQDNEQQKTGRTNTVSFMPVDVRMF